MHLLSPRTRHLDLLPVVEAAMRREPVGIEADDIAMRDMAPVLESVRATHPRTYVALLVWRIAAEYAHDHEPLTVRDSMTLAESAEARVTEIAEEALGATVDGHVVSAPLHAHGVLDDFHRMVRGDQGDAFSADEH